MDEKLQSQQFWLRVLLALGILWGMWLPVQLFEFALTPGSVGIFFNAVADVINCATVGPACFLAFWHRRAACVWLALNAVLAVASAIEFVEYMHHSNGGMIFNAAAPVALAICLAIMEIRRWPRALDKL